MVAYRHSSDYERNALKMAQSFLFIHATPEGQRKMVEHILGPALSWEQNPDILILQEETTHAIQSIRTAISWLDQRPYQHQSKTLVIFDAEKMLPPAQSALLKTLEEPPQYATILLTTTDASRLLPTILSRCIVERSHAEDISAAYEHVALPQTIAESIQFAETQGSNREQAVAWCQDALKYWEEQLRTEPNEKNVFIVEALVRLNKRLKQNLQVKLAMEAFGFELCSTPTE
jgi:hypothetical protein